MPATDIVELVKGPTEPLATYSVSIARPGLANILTGKGIWYVIFRIGTDVYHLVADGSVHNHKSIVLPQSAHAERCGEGRMLVVDGTLDMQVPSGSANTPPVQRIEAFRSLVINELRRLEVQGIR
jgi:hypothetical protein